MPAIHFFDSFTAARAAPCAPPVAAPFAIFAMAFPVFVAPRTEAADDSPLVLCSSGIRHDPFFSGFGASAPQFSHCI